MGSRAPIGEFEQLVLLAVLRLGDGAFGVAVRNEIERRTERPVARGAVYTTLDRLAGKELLRSRMALEGGGPPRRAYSVTERGVAALRETAAAVRALWSGLETVLGER